MTTQDVDVVVLSLCGPSCHREAISNVEAPCNWVTAIGLQNGSRSSLAFEYTPHKRPFSISISYLPSRSD